MPYLEHSPDSGTADSQRVALQAELEEGTYELVRWIGAGGMAQVWLARRPLYGGEQLVAIKLIAESHRGNLEIERLFRREAKLSMRLNHSNIVQAHDLCRVGGRIGLVMEWVDGIDLGQLLRHLRRCEQILSIELATFIVGEVLNGLAYAHAQRGPCEQPIVHCDITPQNVLLSCNGEVKIADYGIAESASERAASTELRGTLRYMAPEQAMGERRGAEVDLYAVGALFHEMLAGRRFRDQVAREDMLEAVMDGDIPTLSRATPPELLELCRSLLAPVLEDRILSASEAAAMLFASGHHRDCRIELAALVSAIVETSTEDPSTVSMTPVDATCSQTWGEQGVGARVPERSWRGSRGSRSSQLGRRSQPWLTVGVGAGLCLALAVGGQVWLGHTGQVELDASALVVEAASHGVDSDAAADSASVELRPGGSSPSLTTIDGRPVADLAASIRLDPGVHTIQVLDPRGGWDWALLEVEAGVDYQVELSAGSRP